MSWNVIGETKRDEPAEGLFKSVAEEEIFADIRATLTNLGITFRMDLQ